MAWSRPCAHNLGYVKLVPTRSGEQAPCLVPHPAGERGDWPSSYLDYGNLTEEVPVETHEVAGSSVNPVGKW